MSLSSGCLESSHEEQQNDEWRAETSFPRAVSSIKANWPVATKCVTWNQEANRNRFAGDSTAAASLAATDAHFKGNGAAAIFPSIDLRSFSLLLHTLCSMVGSWGIHCVIQKSIEGSLSYWIMMSRCGSHTEPTLLPLISYCCRRSSVITAQVDCWW